MSARGISAVPNGRESLAFQFEEYFTPKELATLSKLSEDTIRRMFQDEPGVMKIGQSNPRGKRGYVTLRIPRSVAGRVFMERSR